MRHRLDDYFASPLYAAIEGGHLSTVKLLVRLGADIHQREVAGHHLSIDYPLMTAVYWNRVEIAEWLLELGASVEVTENRRTGANALHYVADSDSPRKMEMAAVLLKHGAKVNARTKRGLTPLHLAKSEEVAALLLEHGAKLDARAKDGSTPLHRAAEAGNRPVAELLITKGADLHAKWLRTVKHHSGSRFGSSHTHREEVTALDLAAEAGNEELLNALLRKGAKWTFRAAVFMGRADLVADMLKEDPKLVETTFAGDGWLGGTRIPHTPLDWATFHNRADLVRYFIRKVEPYASEREYWAEALTHAAARGHLDVVKVLLEAGAAPNAEHRWPLGEACRNGHLEVARLLLKHGAKLQGPREGRRADPPSALYEAARYGHPEIVKLLLQACKDDERKWAVRTALGAAVSFGHGDLVKWLLDQRVGPDAQAENNYLPMPTAVESGRLEMLRLLLEAGGNPTDADLYGRTLLHLAAAKGWAAAVELLLRHKAEVNARDSEGRTPLHLAVEQSDWESVELLLKAGADPNLQDRSSLTPVHTGR
ncbi:MAG TPA: ankyrin repeat domain-containing protein, partial [Gemmataceae bacterium]